MNRPKVRQRYIDLHGDDRHYLKMIEKRIKEYADKTGLSIKEAKEMLDELDRLDEELDIDM